MMMCLFCQVCFFPRLQQFILTQEWNDPKSKLQQCCLTLRTLNGGEPDIPCYKVRLNTVRVVKRSQVLAAAVLPHPAHPQWWRA
jgi:hypothetical protein